MITYGSHVFRYLPEGDLCIFGYILTLDEVRAEERDAGGDADEAAFVVQQTSMRHDLGQLYGRWYSTLVPEGELGNAPRDACLEITENEFEMGKADGWLEDVRHPRPWFLAILARNGVIFRG